MLNRVAPPLSPLLLASFPVLSLFAHNQRNLELSLLWLPLGLSLASAGAAYGIALLTTRNASKAGVLAALLVLAFFFYGLVPRPGGRWFVALWLVVLCVALGVVLHTKRAMLSVTAVVAVGAAAMALPQAVSVGAYALRHPAISATDPRLWPSALATPANGLALPDIYVLMPDDYARADVLKTYFRYDNSPFLSQLERRGFVISEQNRSPYSYSELNMASMLNLDYLTGLPALLGKDSQDFRTVKRLMADNRAARMLAGLGYDYVHLDTDEVTFSGGNPHISPLAPPDSFTNLWMSKTVLGAVGGLVGFDRHARDTRFRSSIRTVFSQLKGLRPGPRPKFVVFHTLMPHDPYVFDANGRPATFPAGADHTSTVGMSYYRHELEYLNRQLLESIDQIRAHANTPPVIVLQADEGFEINPDLVGEQAAQDIRVKGLGAFLLPGAGPGVPEPPNMVNNLRYVFNRYLGTHYDMLPTTSYLEGDRPYDYTPIDVR
jgi:hypothetical protein